MKKRNKLFALVLVLALSMIMTLTAGATSSTGNFVVDCEGAHFTGTVIDGEQVRLEVRLHAGPWVNPGPVVQDENFILSTPGPYDVTVPWAADADGKLHRVAISVSQDGGSTWTQIAHQEAELDCPPPPEGAYCSPGYFKKHLDAWVPTGFTTTDDFDSVFGVDYFDPDITLLDAVNAKGGGDNALARVGTASLLSAAHPEVNYPLSEAEVIAAVQAGDKAKLDQYIDFDCPID